MSEPTAADRRIAALDAAETLDEHLSAVAAAVWHNAHAGADPPPAMVPTEADLVKWLPPWEIFAPSKINAVVPAADMARLLSSRGFEVTGEWHYVQFRLLGDPRLGEPRPMEAELGVSGQVSGPVSTGTGAPTSGISALMVPAEALCATWKALKPRPRRHPLAALVEAWQARPVQVEWDTRQHVNLPAPLPATKYTLPDAAPADDNAHLPFDWDSLATPPPTEPRFEVGYLPTLAPSASVIPVALLDLFGPVASRGQGGPVIVPARIGWEVLVALNDQARAGAAALTIALEDLHKMIYPQTDGWRASTGAALLRGLFNLDASRLRWRSGERGKLYPLVEVWDLPTVPDRAETVTFLSHVPPGGQQGPQIDRFLLRRLAAKSYREHRAMLAAYVLFDRYGTAKGRLIDPTIPVVNRDPAGYVLDARGNVVTEPRGKHRGRASKRATHPLAVQTGKRERNPEAARYPWIEGDDLILLTAGYVADTAAGRRDQRRRTMETVESLAAAGALRFETKHRDTRGGRELVALRLLPTDEHLAAHRSRWAARRHNRRDG